MKTKALSLLAALALLLAGVFVVLPAHADALRLAGDAFGLPEDYCRVLDSIETDAGEFSRAELLKSVNGVPEGTEFYMDALGSIVTERSTLEKLMSLQAAPSSIIGFISKAAELNTADGAYDADAAARDAQAISRFLWTPEGDGLTGVWTGLTTDGNTRRIAFFGDGSLVYEKSTGLVLLHNQGACSAVTVNKIYDLSGDAIDPSGEELYKAAGDSEDAIWLQVSEDDGYYCWAFCADGRLQCRELAAGGYSAEGQRLSLSVDGDEIEGVLTASALYMAEDGGSVIFTRGVEPDKKRYSVLPAYAENKAETVEARDWLNEASRIVEDKETYARLFGSDRAECLSLSPDGNTMLCMVENKGLFLADMQALLLREVTPDTARGAGDVNGKLMAFTGKIADGGIHDGAMLVSWSPSGDYACVTSHADTLVNVRMSYDLFILDVRAAAIFVADTYEGKGISGGAPYQACFGTNGRGVYYGLYSAEYDDRQTLMYCDIETGAKACLGAWYTAFPKLAGTGAGTLIAELSPIFNVPECIAVYDMQKNEIRYEQVLPEQMNASIRYLDVSPATGKGAAIWSVGSGGGYLSVFDTCDGISGLGSIAVSYKDRSTSGMCERLPLSEVFASEDGMASSVGMIRSAARGEARQALMAALSPNGKLALLVAEDGCFLISLDSLNYAKLPSDINAGKFASHTSYALQWSAGGRIIANGTLYRLVCE